MLTEHAQSIVVLIALVASQTRALYCLPTSDTKCLPASGPELGCRQYRFTDGGSGSLISTMYQIFGSDVQAFVTRYFKDFLHHDLANTSAMRPQMHSIARHT